MAVNGEHERRVLHRSPRAIGTSPVRPERRSVPDEPARVQPPSWNTVITGVITGLAIASVSGHWYFALFSIVTAFVSAGSWLVRTLLHRRRRKRWIIANSRIDAEFQEECRRCARELADRRRSAHPSLNDIGIEIRLGGSWFWHGRRLEQVAVGNGRREIVVAEGARAVACDDVPVLVDMTPGQMIGVHGRRAGAVLRALLIRMAAAVGPSDWQLGVLGPMDDCWQAVRRLPHFGPSISFDPVPSRSTSVHGHLVVLVFEAALLQRNAPVMQRLKAGTATVIVIAEEFNELPAGCTVIIDSQDDEIDGVGRGVFDELCESIAKWTDPDVDGSKIPEVVDFTEMLSGRELSSAVISDVWRHRMNHGPRVDLGRDSAGIIHLELDRDGPHVVIVGTTGSGKSEVLRLFVMSMAWNSSPADVSFILVDYKGGSAFDACSQLPHVAGVITDLDEGMALRVLHGLEAELKRRESVLRTARAKDLSEFQSLRMAGHHKGITLPRLVVVIDELAALREEVPEFVPALAAIAQRGRSLGLHLVVATQRPAALSADVVANASVRIALRVQSSGDSVDLVGSDRAAQLDRHRPGRLVLKVGSDEIREVQAARISEIVPDLEQLMSRAFEAESMLRPRRPWSDPLPVSLTRPEGDTSGVVGIVDDVLHQRQELLSYTFDEHIVFVGGRGRTNALRTLLVSLGTSRFEVDVVVISCRPARADGLSRFAVWIDGSDFERLARVLRLCAARAEEQLLNTGLIRRLVLIVDDMDVWFAQTLADRAYAHLWEAFERIVWAGSSSPVVCVLTSSREQGVPSSILARVGSIWRGTQRAGVFRVSDRNGSADVDVQMYWEPPEVGIRPNRNDSLELELAKLPSIIVDSEGAYAVNADSRRTIRVAPDEQLALLVIGHRGTGVSTALRALTRSWATAHPAGRVIDVAAMCRDPATGPWPDAHGANSPSGSEPVLMVVDEVHRLSAHATEVSRVVDDPNRSGLVSVIVGVTPMFMRSNPDHWIHRIRRSRTGVLLGRSIDEDGDLLGVHAQPVNFYPQSAGRGLWVDGGACMGIVQFLVDDTQ